MTGVVAISLCVVPESWVLMCVQVQPQIGDDNIAGVGRYRQKFSYRELPCTP